MAWLPGFLGQLVTIWSIDSYPRRIDAYPRLKRRVSQTFEQETCLLSRSTFCGRFMRQNGFRAKLCVREIIFDSSIQAQWAGEVIRQNWRGYGSYASLLIQATGQRRSKKPFGLRSTSARFQRKYFFPLSANLRKIQVMVFPTPACVTSHRRW